MSSFFNYHIKGRVKMTLERAQLLSSALDPLLVFTMAKVGSSSVYNSVKRITSIPCFHIHTLDEKETSQANQRCFDEGLYPDSRSPGRFINKDILEKQRPFKAISLFRNPVERNLSAFFDAFRLLVGTPAHSYQGSMEGLATAFYEKVNHDYPIQWYQKHFLPGIGVDVYRHAFDPKKGYSILQEGQCSVLLMNATVSDTVKESVIADFLGEPSFKLTNANIRAESKEASLYKEFKSYISLDSDYLDRMMNNQYFEHFFTKNEREQTLKTWLKS